MATYHHMTPLPPSQPPAPKKRSSGCLIAVVVIAVLLGVGCIATAVLVGAAAQTPEGKRAFSMLGKGMGVLNKALTAPGAKEVREAGCPEAGVIDLADVAEVFGELVDGGMKTDGESVVVFCQGTFSLPTCDEVATAYRNAPGVKPGPFKVIVKRKSAKKNQCEQDY
ncbi:MAG: hypothetical protein DI536_34205 [Archangium gephyra]|uniref:Uncharacterized protein n=1 Tax=Archangium gephyra TaxID=48 RepID=A0A2W5SUF0_9BACT|nr:MAG: hypothetical protein DI536_34205 [Archangium gephyra]